MDEASSHSWWGCCKFFLFSLGGEWSPHADEWQHPLKKSFAHRSKGPFWSLFYGSEAVVMGANRQHVMDHDNSFGRPGSINFNRGRWFCRSVVLYFFGLVPENSIISNILTGSLLACSNPVVCKLFFCLEGGVVEPWAWLQPGWIFYSSLILAVMPPAHLLELAREWTMVSLSLSCRRWL